MSPLLGTGMETAISDLTTAITPYGTAAAALVGAGLLISVGIAWVKRFGHKAA